MNTPLLALVTLLLSCAARGQFYAPPVDYYDTVQRRFPVEVARVLAFMWQGQSAEIAEVTWSVHTDAKAQTLWNLAWRPSDPRGKVVPFTVRYAEKDLRNGADWYRSVWQQLCGSGYGLAKAPGGELAPAFWEGAHSAGLSRMEGVAAALKLLPGSAKPAADRSARLAGALTQSAQPMLGNCLTLDGTLLARSAAWLCAAEQQSGAKAGAPWAALLALAGRGPEALAAWRGAKEPSGAAAPLWRAWDLIVRLPPATEALPLAAQPENRLYAAPVFEAYASTDPAYDGLLAELGQKLYPGDRWGRLYDFGASLIHDSVNRQRVADDFPARAVRAWLGVLRPISPAPGDAAEAPVLAKAVQDDKKKLDPLAPPSPELAQLLNLGVHQGEGPLGPVGVVTARDLLVFGWEQAGLQYGTLHTGLSILQSGRDQARDLEKNWFGAVEGWAVFTQNLKLPVFSPLPESDRYEFILASRVAFQLLQQPPAAWPKTPGAYGQRRWLADPHRALDFMLRHDGTPEQATRFVRRSIQEGDQGNLGDLLAQDNHFMWDVSGHQWQAGHMVEMLKLRDELLRAVPLSVNGPLSALGAKLAGQKDPFAYAQALERLHWQSGLAIAPQTVFLQYVRAQAFTSANRFYNRWQEAMPDRQRFQETLGPANFALAVLQNNEERAQAALRDCAPSMSGEVEIAAAFLSKTPEDAAKPIDAWVGRFPKAPGAPRYQKLRDYISLIPALNDPKDPRHEQALTDYPKTSATFLLPQWALLARAHLPPAEAVRFFDDGTGQGERALIIAALKGDRPAFESLYASVAGPPAIASDVRLTPNESRRTEGSRGVLCAWLRNLLLKTPPPKTEPDLMPAGAAPLLPRLRSVAAMPAH
jgi:hypothetical protein